MLIRLAIVINLLWFGFNVLAKEADQDEVFWQVQTDKFTIRWSQADILVTDPHQKTLFSAAALAKQQFTADFTSADRCNYDCSFILLSVVGTIASLQDSEVSFCQDSSSHPDIENRFMSIDLAKAGRPTKLTDLFAEADILKALLANSIVKSALKQAKSSQVPTNLQELYKIFKGIEIPDQGCPYNLPADFLNQFAFHHVNGNQIAVRLKLQPQHLNCEDEQLGFYLPIPANFQLAVKQAQTGQVGFLMRTSPIVTYEKITSFYFSTLPLTTNDQGVTPDSIKSPPSTQAISQRIITVSQARLRSEATRNSQIIAKLPLGMLVKQVGRSQQPELINQVTNYWYQITTPTGKKGWIFGGLTQSFEPQQRPEIYQQLAQSYQTKQLNLLAQIELTDWLGRAKDEVATSPQVAAELALAQLLSLQKIAAQINNKLSHQAWLTKQKQQKWLRYDEIQGRWLVNVNRGWQLHAQYYPLPVADQIAWVAATLPLGGECEGLFECQLSALDQTIIRYLKYHSTGNQVEPALKQLIQFLDNYLAVPRLKLTTEDQELPRLLAVLEATLEKVNSPHQAEISAKLNKLTQTITDTITK